MFRTHFLLWPPRTWLLPGKPGYRRTVKTGAWEGGAGSPEASPTFRTGVASREEQGKLMFLVECSHIISHHRGVIVCEDGDQC